MKTFKENLRDELNFQGMTVKELAAKTGLVKGSLDNYLGVRASIPPADVAVKIAKALNVSVEYLLDLTEDESVPANTETAKQEKMTKIFQKYGKLINQLEKLSQKEQKAVLQLVETLAK